MGKKATREQQLGVSKVRHGAENLGSERRRTRSLPIVDGAGKSTIPSSQGPGSPVSALSDAIQASCGDCSTGSLEELIEGLAGYLGESEGEQTELRDYLEMLVESDPMLKEEILQCLKDRN